MVLEGLFDLWFDQESLLPGQDWRLEIEKALDMTDVVLICLSKRSVTKDGFVQREMHYTLDRSEEKPEGAIFLIPVKLEPCDIPLRLKRIHWVDLFQHNGGYHKLLRALFKRAIDLGISSEPAAFLLNDLQTSAFTPLDKTMANPHYEIDTKALEQHHYSLSAVLSKETILIVVGCWIPAELCDRPVAEMVRDEIDKRGQKYPHRRGIVVTDAEWFKNQDLQRHPAIAIGGPQANALTDEIYRKAPPKSTWNLKGLSGAFLAGPPLRVALWGTNARDTRSSAEKYLKDTEGLRDLLGMCWQ